VTVLAVLASSVSGLIHEVNSDPGEDSNKQIPHFLPLAFPLPNGNASTCQALCKMSPDCQYFVFMNIGYDDFYPSGTCHFGKRPITTALGEAWGFSSGTPDGPILQDILALSDIEMIHMDGYNPYGYPDDLAEDCYRLCLDSEDCHHWGFTETFSGGVGEVFRVCYLDKRTDIQGNKMISLYNGEGGDRNTPPGTPDYRDTDIPVYDIAEDAEKPQNTTEKPQNTTEKARPSNPGEKLTQNLFGKKM